ncbi:hypothetical protein BKP37_08520 [Anaerobacillus alkalilacustris]|uniref:Uncharacterized protein n=1 Tax=Anaerobacillus alkalilacustris TaxID=393763 RepID=A0A1S2LQ93_9BACI|nr:hypothetical protein BKP37_08520 [Anaerobacillus alkalilacustris]
MFQCPYLKSMSEKSTMVEKYGIKTFKPWCVRVKVRIIKINNITGKKMIGIKGGYSKVRIIMTAIEIKILKQRIK